jgi:hypothetical protein
MSGITNSGLRIGAVSQVIKHLPSKHEAESKPQCHQKRKKNGLKCKRKAKEKKKALGSPVRLQMNIF